MTQFLGGPTPLLIMGGGGGGGGGGEVPTTFKPCKAKQPIQGMELQEKEATKIKHTGNLFRKNLH